MQKQSQTFCALPWMHIASSSSGSLKVCCNSIHKNFILNLDERPYKIYKDDIKEAWHSPVYQKIRNQMLNGERPAMCEQCLREEDFMVESSRQRVNKQWKSKNHWIIIFRKSSLYFEILNLDPYNKKKICLSL